MNAAELAPGRPGAASRPVNFLRIFFIGGLMSYRALFSWLRPSVLIPTFLISPIFQILLFVYLGRAAHLASDSFFVIGDAIQFAALPCLFAMGNTIADERQAQTLSLVLATPAARLPLFLGRSLPELAVLKAVARQRLAAGQGELDLGLEAGGPGGRGRGGGPLPIISSRMGHLLDALQCAYGVLGLDGAAGGDEVFGQLVIARIIEPVSELDSLRVLEE